MTFKTISNLLFVATLLLATTSCQKVTNPNTVPTTGTGTGTGGGTANAPATMLELTLDGEKVTGSILHVEKKNITSTVTWVTVFGTFGWRGKTRDITIGFQDYKGVAQYGNTFKNSIHFAERSSTVDSSFVANSKSINVTAANNIYLEANFSGNLDIKLWSKNNEVVGTVDLTDGKFIGHFN